MNMGCLNRRVAFTFLILMGLYVGGKNTQADLKDPESVVAVVNGEAIKYKDIKADLRFLQLGSPDKLSSSEEKEAINEYENRQLAAKISKVIINQKIKLMGLGVSEEEINREIDERFKKANIDKKKANEITETYRALANALEAWQKNPQLADVIFNEKLESKGILKEQWNAFQISYDTPEKLAKMRSLIPNNIDEMKQNSRESVKEDLLFRKMIESIASDVSVGNDEIETYYHDKYGSVFPKPALSTIKEEIQKTLLNDKRQEAERNWWQNQYKMANIEIKDERFKDVIKMLIMPGEK